MFETRTCLIYKTIITLRSHFGGLWIELIKLQKETNPTKCSCKVVGESKIGCVSCVQYTSKINQYQMINVRVQYDALEHTKTNYMSQINESKLLGYRRSHVAFYFF